MSSSDPIGVTQRLWREAMLGGQAAFARRRFAEAAEAFRKAAALTPERMEPWANLGGALLELGRPEDALDALERARALAPDAPAVLMNLGRACYLLGRADAALEACHRAVALAPGAETWNRLGVLLRGCWQLTEAERAFRAALRFDERHPLARVNLATLMLLTGRQAEAAPMLAAALADPLPEFARREAQRALMLVAEWQRIDPVLQCAFRRAEFAELASTLEQTGAGLLDVDPAVGPFLERLARSAARHEGAGTVERHPFMPAEWPWIEAHFSMHLHDSVEQCLASIARADEASTGEGRELAQLANAARLRRESKLATLYADLPEVALRYMHWLILHEVDDARFSPGHFKLQPNRVSRSAGEPRAAPEYVTGTLRYFFRELLPTVAAAEARAALVYLMVLKTHCFIDGNGRVARMLLNLELELHGQAPILVGESLEASWREAMQACYRSASIGPLVEQIATARSFTRGFLDELSLARDRFPRSAAAHPSGERAQMIP